MLKVRKTFVSATCIRRFALGQQNDVIKETPDLRSWLMYGDNDGSSFSGEVSQRLHDLKGTCRVKTSCGFIQPE